MSWTKRSEYGTGLSGKPWSADEVELMTDAVRRAPSVHNTRPWTLDIQGRSAFLRERRDVDLLRHDPHGRDRRMSCGAAVTNLVLAVREAGWSADVHWQDDGTDVIAVITGSSPRKPTAIESQRFRAITRRVSHRQGFASQGLQHSIRESLWSAARMPPVAPRWVVGAEEALAVARLLGYAARVHHADPSYQRELELWTTAAGSVTGDGVAVDAFGTEGLSAVGLTTSATRIPDEFLLASRIEQESVLVLSTSTDDSAAQYRAGEAMEMAWLAATSFGVAASVMTQPLQLPEVRTGLSDRLGLPGTVQSVMRFGYPAGEVVRSPQ